MPTYVFLKTANDRGVLRELFEDAANATVQEDSIAALGGRVLAQYAVGGVHDFVLIADLPDDATAAVVSLQCNGRGVRTAALRAFSPDEITAALRDAAPNA